ncbi:flavin-dependent dehydrogenase [Streptomyces sp. TE3672]
MDEPLLSLRTTLVFLLALLAGTTAGTLTALAGEGTPHSLLAGLAAAGLAVPFFNRLIDAEGSQSQQRERADADTGEGPGNG